MRALLRVLLLLALAPAAALAQTPPETSPDQPAPGEVPSPEIRIPEEESKLTLVPLPIVYSDPNIGVGYGFMPVILIHPQRRIDWIIAPSYDYNEVVGSALTSRVFYYPTPKEEFVAYNSVTTGDNTEHSFHFRGYDRFYRYTSFFARAYYITDGTKRFFGLGAKTREDDETDYQLTETGIEGDFGYRFFDVLRVGGTSRYRRSRVRGGILDELPDTVGRFPTLRGLGRSDIDVLALGARITLDLRDDAAIPSDGLLADAYVEVSAKGVVSDTRYARWGASFVHHLPVIRPTSWVSVLRGRYSAIDGDQTFPFWELPTLGGAEHLRGYGLGRYTHDQYIVLSIEQRIRFAEMIVRENHIMLEAAPFLDVGRVFGRDEPLTRHHWQFVPGAGIRILLPESAIVARFDLGYSKEQGSAVFVILGYPF